MRRRLYVLALAVLLLTVFIDAQDNNPDEYSSLKKCLGTQPRKERDSEGKVVYSDVWEEQLSFWHNKILMNSCKGRPPQLNVGMACTKFEFVCEDDNGLDWRESWRTTCDKVAYEYEYRRNGRMVRSPSGGYKFINSDKASDRRLEHEVGHLFGQEGKFDMNLEVQEEDYAMFLKIDADGIEQNYRYTTNSATCNLSPTSLWILMILYCLILLLVVLRLTIPGRIQGYDGPWPTFLPEPKPSPQQLIFDPIEKKKPYKQKFYKKGPKWPKLKTYICAETAFLGVFFSDWGHPYTPDERALTLIARHAQMAFASVLIGTNDRAQPDENPIKNLFSIALMDTILGALFALATVVIPSQILKKDWENDHDSRKRYLMWLVRIWLIVWTVFCLVMWVLWLPGWGAVKELLLAIFIDGWIVEPLTKGGWYLIRRKVCGLEKHSINVDALAKRGIVSPEMAAMADAAQKDGKWDEKTQAILNMGQPGGIEPHKSYGFNKAMQAGGLSPMEFTGLPGRGGNSLEMGAGAFEMGAGAGYGTPALVDPEYAVALGDPGFEVMGGAPGFDMSSAPGYEMSGIDDGMMMPPPVSPEHFPYGGGDFGYPPVPW